MSVISRRQSCILNPETFVLKQTHSTTQPVTGVELHVGVALTIMVVMLSLALLIFCRTRTNNNKDASADTELTSVTEANRVNEEIREDRRSRSPPEASSASVYANFTKPTETTSDHSLTTAASSQHKTEDDLSKLIYSQVDFSNAATALLHSGHVTSGHANDVIYSVLQVQESSDRHHTGDSSPPLYSVISKH
ncbi:uncharacterized protein LOC122981697 isoform X2 [Thunnus albacares]|uniref:uncharacterized protein LOC122981697 isoform X2 n=1 Tax=Thunnus albacares TaxID=8236 RepID=UPI001CF6B958|nr:uncharacterized protein LOC122981697 isoform X2 [Thunnus albacares]